MDDRPTPVPLRRNRDFQLLWSGQAVSVLGSRMSSIAYPLLVLALTGSPAKAGIVGFAGTIPYFLAPLVAGVLVDRATEGSSSCSRTSGGHSRSRPSSSCSPSASRRSRRSWR
ncbi:MAG: MFS transporter [Gaiellaceae bacterium]